MKIYALISFLCVVAFVDSKSFDFSSFFPFNAYKTDAAPTTPSNIFSDSDPSLETISFPSSEYLEQELNASEVSTHKSNESIHSETTEGVLSSSTENLDNATSAEVRTQSSTKSEESLNSWPSSAPPPGSNSSLETSSLESSFNSTEEAEEVVLNSKPSTFTFVTKTIYEKTIEWVGDTYTLSILAPVVAGVLFAVSIILTVATCRCIRRKCWRRTLRKRVLPDSIKNLGPSDQARLLGDCDSSDEF